MDFGVGGVLCWRRVKGDIGWVWDGRNDLLEAVGGWCWMDLGRAGCSVGGGGTVELDGLGTGRVICWGRVKGDVGWVWGRAWCSVGGERRVMLDAFGAGGMI
ncbi:hypothetical protein chiPu_0028570, partial [Chiloscyllium punctatum]|nr:hypothetical protein [Chiloscyllium punctatum]